MNSEKNDNVIAVYSRKSRFTGKGESIGNQIELCREYIRIHYGEDAVKKIIVYEDEGFSGGNLNRPDFKRMMEAAKEHKFKAVVVYRLDRISRNISDFAGLIQELGKLEIDFVSIREQFDTATPMGRAMMYIASVFSQLERETIAERIRDNMRELAKTGRWLGGITPTGYTSEAVQSITIDGKTKKICKLKLLNEEAEIVRLIYDLYIETDSLTKTEGELIRRGIKTKNDNLYTRFSIKSILQNPVYLIADNDAYEYFISAGTDLFSGKEAFDEAHGIMAYNRTAQEKGKATEYLPTSEWIVSVGLHKGLIPGKTWVKVQQSLERNKSKAYRKPRNNEALLTGLLYCSCGNRMYPKLSKRTTADDKPIYTYVCKLKENSQKLLCSRKNANGNVLDAAIIEQIKQLEGDKATFIDSLEKSRKFYTGNRTDYEQHIAEMKNERAEVEKKIEALVDTLTVIGESSAKTEIAQRIEKLGFERDELSGRITELESLTSQHALSDIEFDLMRQLLSVFSSSIDEMTVEQKRAAIRTLVRKVVWDGESAHVYLFGAEDDTDFPQTSEKDSENISEDDDNEELEPFGDVNYNDEEGIYEIKPFGDSKTPWGEDSKRDPHVFPFTEKDGGGCEPERYP
ncbi:MAG: recombinase family protein [Eubacteriales bacterium]|nr:recombinase family protein [Eubacteriales bacterium]